MSDLCEIRQCRRPADVTYLARGVCGTHWNQLMNETAPTDSLRMALGIEPGPDPMETDMSKKKTDSKPEVNETANGAPEKPVKTAKPPKPEKAAKKREPKEENLVVFAFRLTESERKSIHDAAGPGGASRFVRTIAVAAANEDEAAIRGVIKEARELR